MTEFTGDSLVLFVLGGVLGSGSGGVVYGAINESGEVISVKLDFCETESQTGLAREVYLEMSKKISNPNAEDVHIAKLFKMLDHSGKPLISVMEFVQGQPLSKYLLANPSTEAEARDIVKQVVLGIRSIPSGFSHRDLSPSNVLISRDKKIKIIDFDLMSMDCAYEECFSFGYYIMPPEELGRCMGEAEVKLGGPNKHAVDMWAAGLIFLSLISKSLIMLNSLALAPEETNASLEQRLSQINGAFGDTEIRRKLIESLQLSKDAVEFLFGKNGILNLDPNQRLGAFEKSEFLGLEESENHVEYTVELEKLPKGC